MSGHEREQCARLDAGIDALLAGEQLDPADAAVDLLATARLVRALPSEPVWPAADYPTQLATRLAAALRPTGAVQPSLVLPNGVEAPLRAAGPDAAHAPRVERRWWRQAAQLAAALAAFGLVGLVLVLVFRPGGGHDDGSSPLQLGASPADVCQPSTPLISATTGELTYFVGDQDNQKIYRAAPDGSDAVVMQTHAGVDDFTLSWSPDANWFAFVNTVGRHVVMIASADGQTSRRLTGELEAVEGEPAWSPDGRTIAYASDRDHRGPTAILSSSPDGKSTTRLSPDDTAIYSHPVWSPDGRQIAFLRNDRLMVVNADGSNAHPLDNTQQIASGIAWAPDSCRVAFSSEVNGTGDIYVVDAAGGVARALTSGAAEDWTPAWVSNDELVFARQEFKAADPEFAADLYLIHADGSDIHKLVGLPRVKQKTPIVAPDGMQLAFAGFNYDTQHWEQYVVDLASGHVQRMVVGLMPGSLTPAWRPVSTPNAATPTSAAPTPTIAALPTPDASGIVRAASFSEAQALVTFPIVMPEPLPDGVTFDEAAVEFAPPGTTGTPGTTSWGAARDVTLNFKVTSADPNVRPPGIQFLQSTLHNEVAADEHTTVTQVTLGGKQVTKLLLKRDEGGDVLSYNWSTATVSYTVVSVLRDGVTEELVAQLVAATPLPDGATIAPPEVPVSPTPPHPPATVESTTPSASGEPYQQIASWDAQLQTAAGMVAGPDGSVYLIDSTHGHIRVFAPDGSLTREWDLPPGDSNGGPNDIALGPDGDIYALDGGDALVLKYDQSGNLITSWGGHASEKDHSQLGKFVSPFDIAVSADGIVYVSELTFNSVPRVQRFTAEGHLVDEWFTTVGALPSAGGQHLYTEGNRVYVGQWKGGGEIPSIKVFDADHNLIATPLAGDGGSSGLSGLGLGITSFAVDVDGNIFLADTAHMRVVKLSPDGVMLASWPIESVEQGEFFIVAVGDDGRVYTEGGLSQQVTVFARSESSTVSLNPNSGTCTSQFSVIVKGFAPNSLVTISVGPADGGSFTDLMTLPTDADGTESLSRNGLNELVGCADGALPAPGAQFTVRAAPFDPQGAGTAPNGASASATFTYLGETPAQLTVTPSVGACDTPEVVSGVDFTAGTALAIYVNLIGGDDPALAANATVAGDGTFNAALDVTSIRACAPGFNPDAVYVVWAGPDAGKLGNGIPGRSAGTLFFAARDVPVAVATRERLPFCGADPEVARQFIDPTDAPLICLRDAAARGEAGEMATSAVTSERETIKLYRASGGAIKVITATRATDELQYAWTRQTCASVEVSVQPISVSGCSAVEQLPLAR